MHFTRNADATKWMEHTHLNVNVNKKCRLTASVDLNWGYVEYALTVWWATTSQTHRCGEYETPCAMRTNKWPEFLDIHWNAYFESNDNALIMFLVFLFPNCNHSESHFPNGMTPSSPRNAHCLCIWTCVYKSRKWYYPCPTENLKWFRIAVWFFQKVCKSKAIDFTFF